MQVLIFFLSHSRRVSMLPGDSPQDGAGSDTAQSLTEGAEAQGSNVTGEAPLPQRVHLQESTRLGESNRDDENSRVVAADDAEPGDNARAHVDATGQGGLLAEHHESGDDTQAHVDAAAAVGADEELRRPEDGTLAHVDNADDAENEVEDNHDDERGAVDPNGWEEDLDGEVGGDISEDGGAHELNDEDAVMRRGREIEEVVARRRAKNKMSVAAFRMICGEVRGKIRHIFFANGISSFEGVEAVNGTLFYVLSDLGYIEQVPLDDAECRTEKQLNNRRTLLGIVTETVAQTGRDFRHEVLETHSAA